MVPDEYDFPDGRFPKTADIKTLEGTTSEFEVVRPVFLSWVNRDFPGHVCDGQFQVHSIVEGARNDRFARVTARLKNDQRKAEWEWSFLMINEQDEWKIFLVELPERALGFPY
ncbi:MAG: hypothetical protein IPM63_16805 [Acidobacteriota bacterium]|nr:MAG: hypothetical protein IPM63_16805 [Acidobacteriota bacterium]